MLAYSGQKSCYTWNSTSKLMQFPLFFIVHCACRHEYIILLIGSKESVLCEAIKRKCIRLAVFSTKPLERGALPLWNCIFPLYQSTKLFPPLQNLSLSNGFPIRPPLLTFPTSPSGTEQSKESCEKSSSFHASHKYICGEHWDQRFWYVVCDSQLYKVWYMYMQRI